MPKASELILSTDREVAGARPADGSNSAVFRVSGVRNLVLRVSSTGRKAWRLRLKDPQSGKWNWIGLGAYPAVRLAVAREEGLRITRQAAEGADPFEQRREARSALTVAELGAIYVERHAKPKKRSWAEDDRRLEVDVYPVLGRMIAAQVKRRDVVKLLDRIADRGAAVSANRALALVRKLFSWAVAEGYVETNPASGIPTRVREEARARVLTPGEIAALWAGLAQWERSDARKLHLATIDALRLALLTGARIGEIVGLHVRELENGETGMLVWRLPKERCKGGRELVRPFGPMAEDIIRRRRELAEKDRRGFLFASPVKRCGAMKRHSAGVAVQRLAALGLAPAGWTPHDLRRTCRTGLARLGVPEPVAKKLLGHVPPRADVTAFVYDQHTYLPEMREALTRWESWLAGEVYAATDDLGSAR